MSSMWQFTPSSYSNIFDIILWKISRAEIIPNGSWIKQNLPNSARNFVGSQDCLSNGICQKPEFASNSVNILLPISLARFLSTWISCFTILFNAVKSMQILTSPFLLGAITMLEHQSVGTVTCAITFWKTTTSNFSFTLGTVKCQVPMSDKIYTNS